MTGTIHTCTTCKWSKKNRFLFINLGDSPMLCTCPNARRILDLVTGKLIQRWKYCSAQRIGDPGRDTCGESGSWWEPRP